MIFECRFSWLFVVIDSAARPEIQSRSGQEGKFSAERGNSTNAGKRKILILKRKGEGRASP
jgi:hypothetical protein